ncbi:MAG: nitroreductase family protein, partial [Ilumatobacteraceae bacterium]
MAGRQVPGIDRASADKLLTTTRSVRKRLDLERPVEIEVVRECIDIAFQAPTGTNAQNWSFVVVTDPDKRAAIADAYRRG